MKRTLILLLALCSTAPMAKVINFEVKFTPFIGDQATADSVKTVAGKATVLLNNVPIAERLIDAQDAMVLFDEREVSASVWVPVASLGSVIRNGANTLKIEFEPADPSAKFRTQFSWAEVNDQSTEQVSEDSSKSTNQSGEGQENKEAQGKVIVEKNFTAYFAVDQPWHHFPAITAISEDDKQQLLTLVNERTQLFQPKFDGIYQLLAKPQPGIELDLKKLRKMACLDKAYAAGVRIAPRNADELDMMLSGNQEIIIKGKTGNLYGLNEKDFAKIKGDELKMCAGMTLSLVYPQRLIAVKNPTGGWEIVY